MAKKSLKKQPEQPTIANSATVSTTTPPSVSPSAPVLSPAPSPYKPITDNISIECLVGLAKNSPTDSALGIAWKHAYEEGFQNGRLALLQNLERKLEEKYKEGEKEGRKKGERYYGNGIVQGKYKEHNRWIVAGHSDCCLRPTTVLEESCTQMDSLDTTTSVSTQTESTIAVSSQTRTSSITTTLSTTTGTQTNLPATTMDAFIQTNPTITQSDCHIIQLPSSSPTSVSATPAASLATTGTQTTTTTSQHLEISTPTHIATMQSPTFPGEMLALV